MECRGGARGALRWGEREALQERLRGAAEVKEMSRKRRRGVGGASEERKKNRPAMDGFPKWKAYLFYH